MSSGGWVSVLREDDAVRITLPDGSAVLVSVSDVSAGRVTLRVEAAAVVALARVDAVRDMAVGRRKPRRARVAAGHTS